jgi:hypothetical protein
MRLCYVIHQFFPDCHSGTEQYCLWMAQEALKYQQASGNDDLLHTWMGIGSQLDGLALGLHQAALDLGAGLGGCALDLGGIAKGYAIDQAIADLVAVAHRRAV